MEFEEVLFSDVNINAYFYIKVGERNLTFQKKDLTTAKNIFTFKIKEFELYDKVLVAKQHSEFLINY